MIWIIILAFFGMIAIGVPIAFSMGLAGLSYIMIQGIPIAMASQRFFSTTQSFAFLAVPFFILAGNLMVEAGIARRIVNFAAVLVRQLPGGLACVSVITSMIMAGVSGSSVADAASTGSILIPEMNNQGYDKSFSVAINATTSVVGIIIPPSSTMIIIGLITNLSVGEMFMAGAIPGVMISMIYLVITVVISKRRGYPQEKHASLREIGRATIDTGWALLLPFILMGSIIFGFATPTQAASLSALYALLVGAIIYRSLGARCILKALVDTAKSSTAVMMVVCSASVFQWVLVRENIPSMISAGLLSLELPGWLLLFVMVLILFLAGMVMDNVPNLFIFLPIYMPIAMTIGVNPIQFSIVVLISLALGLFTPPVGTTLFISCNIAKIGIEECVRDLIPFFFGGVAVVLLTLYIPPLTLFLPNLIFH